MSSKRARHDPEPTPDEAKEMRRMKLLRCIEHVAAKLVRRLAAGQPLVLCVPDRCWANTVYNGRLARKPRPEVTLTQVRFGCRSSREKFATMLHVLGTVYLLLMKRETSTKRQLFYRDKALYRGRQSGVDRAVNDICRLLGAAPWELGVAATSKGLVAGPLTMVTADGREVDCGRQGGVMIPHDVPGISCIASTALAIIVVEKDAAFQKCIDEGVLSKPWLMITGKGFPDVNSRLFVNVLWKTLQIPVYALVDADPYGIEIMCTYRFGSCELAHLADRLATPAMQWLGVYPTDIQNYIIPSVPLAPVDVAKLESLLARSYVQAHPRLRAQVQHMLDANQKAEIEAISSIATRYTVNVYIPNKLRGDDFV